MADSFASFGIPAAATYFVASRAPALQVRRMAGRLSLGVSVLAYLILVAYGVVVANNLGIPQWQLATVWLAVIPGAILASRRGVVVGLNRLPAVDAERAANSLARLIVICGLAVAGAGAVFLYGLAPIIVALAISFVLIVPASRSDPDPGRTKVVSVSTFAKYASLTAFSSILMVVSTRIDQLVLPAVVSANQLGYYAVAVTVSEIPMVLAAVLSRNALQTVSESGSVARGVRLTAIFGLFGLAMCFLLALIVPVALPWIFGSAFESSISLVLILLFAGVARIGSAGLCATLAGIGRPGISMAPYLASAIVVSGYLVLYGMRSEITVTGCAIASTAGSAAGLLVGIFAISWARRSVPSSASGVD